MATTKMIDHRDLCVRRCLETAESCKRAMFKSLQWGGEHAEMAYVALLSNCAKICETNAEFLMSGSSLHVVTCATCAEVCEKCADEVGKRGRELDDCVRACRQCAESCWEMAKHATFKEPSAVSSVVRPMKSMRRAGTGSVKAAGAGPEWLNDEIPR